MTLRAVTFDYWRTLVWEPAGELERVRLEHWTRILSREGHDVAPAKLAAAHAYAFDHASASWMSNVQYVVEHAVSDMLEHLALAVDDSLQAELEHSFSLAGADTPLHLAPGVREVLEGLRGIGVRVAIVCDVGLTPSPVLREHLSTRGLLDLFDYWSFSDETGDYKPSVAPFMHACAGLGVPAGETAHVGDQRRTDVVGAMAAGLTAVRYAGVYDDLDDSLPSGDVVIRHHQELLGALRLK